MSTYYKQGWSGRVGALGDEAENAFLDICPVKAERYGLNRAEINLSKVSAFVRYTPDFLLHDSLVECMGVGRDGVLKMKLEKLDALCQWSKQHPTFLFIYDSAARMHTLQTIEEVRYQCEFLGKMQRFPEGKPAWFLHLTPSQGWNWKPMPDAAAA